jgi:NAD(P)-dependent dehydrogenase (short-subunit alcohol dehydrogenase family)
MFPAPHRCATVDVADDMQVGQWARHELTTLGPHDISINNAAPTHTPAHR